ncbi:MAG: RNase adapter RapZ [Acidimicrobiia bacterium]
MSEFILITGLSGAGRSQAADSLEDLGWFVIDNLPTALIEKVAELASAPGSATGKIALAVGTGPHSNDVVQAIAGLRAAGHRVRVLYLEANTAELVRRYGSTRRRHPLGDAAASTLPQLIERERTLLEAVKAEADVVIDTSALNIHQLRARLVDLFASDLPHGGMQTTITSFGYKHGLPIDVDLVFDCRFLPNPYWVAHLRDGTGLDEPVRDYVLSQDLARPFLDQVEGLLDLLIPAYVAEGKAYLSVAFGCTGGHHRSVAMAEDLARRLRRKGFEPKVSHRDIER